MKTKIEIKSIFGKVLFEFEKEGNDIKDTLVKAVAEGADLRGAHLRGADLRGAHLRGADLQSADLQDADLRDAYLQDAYLHDADLRGADLQSADLQDAGLRGAYLRGAYLQDAYLHDADLRGADLRGADLQGADLQDADLRGAYLQGAYLRGANLQGAYLRGANLQGAYLQGAYLQPIKNDFFIVLLHGLPEIKFLKKNIIGGKINGSTYSGDCACLSGTLVNGARITDGEQEEEVTKKIMSCRDNSRPIERFFLGIKKGDTPETNPVSKIVLGWLEEFENLIKE